MHPSFIDKELFAGLKELAESSFPKYCGCCHRIYRNSAEFLAATLPLRTDSSGLKQSLDDNDHIIVNLFRNCVCGSTLLECFRNRRDLSKEGIKRRLQFQDMVDKLVAKGCPEATARVDLLKIIHGGFDVQVRQH